jgi:hypothetical protein
MVAMLVGASFLLTGCGDEGAHLPAGMTGSSAAYSSATGNDVVDSVLGSDPGPQMAGVSTMVDDPVLAGYDGIDSLDGAGLDDPYSRAIADWSETEGSLGTMDGEFDDYDDDFMPVGYGGDGYGYGDDLYGYGGGVLGAAAYGGYGDAGFMDAGMMDAGFEDPGLMDAGFEDPGFADPGFVDAGFDAGMVDVGFDPGVDPGIGMDAGFVDPGIGMDAGFADVGMDAGIVF